MAAPRNVAVLVGSLRKASYSRQLANAIAALASPSLNLSIVEIGDLPLYNEDWEASPPAAVAQFRDAIKAADAFLFVTPEYNRSVPGPLKNAIDVASRPYGQSGLSGKPAAIVSASQGAMGGFGANQHLRPGLVCLNVSVMPHEAFIGQVQTLLDAQGQISNDGTRQFLTQFVTRFADWIERNGAR